MASVNTKLRSRKTAARRPAPPLRPPASYDLYRITVDEYHRMIDAGILRPEHRMELLEGWLVKKMPNNPAHAYPVQRLTRLLIAHLPQDWTIRIQLPITLLESEPEPDVAIVRGPDDRYVDRHPFADDVGLLIEVANESLSRDRKDKLRIYSAARIAEYWIVNVKAGAVDVYARPKNGKDAPYPLAKSYRRADHVPLVLDGRRVAEIPVREMLP
jgi:Uma2 family endonuclease